MSRKDSGSAGPFMGSSRGDAPYSKRRPPGPRKSDIPPRGTSGCALLPISARSIKRPATSNAGLVHRVGIVGNAVILLPSITSIDIAVFDGSLKAAWSVAIALSLS